MPSGETGQMSAVETGQMTAAETSVLSQQKTSVLSQCCLQLLLAAADCSRPSNPRLRSIFVRKTECCLLNLDVRSTLPGVFEGDINSECIFERDSGCADFAGSQYGQPPRHQTVRTPQLKLLGEL